MGFEGDYTIHVSKLIRLWVAEGFLYPPCETSNSFEDVAEEYLENLVKRSLVLVTRRNSNGKIKSCCIHDLVRDLCIKKTREENFLPHISRKIYVTDQRRKSIARSESDLDFHENTDCSNMHTFICLDGCEITPLSFSGNFRYLRILDVVNIRGVKMVVTRLPDQVFELFHLRYLAFSYSRVLSLSPSISRLQNLQTLVINTKTYCSSLSSKRLTLYLPSEIWKMPQLRHLVSSCLGLLPEPEGGATTALRNLHNLTHTLNFKCTEKILTTVPNLKKLGIHYKGEDTSAEDYHLQNLVYLDQLEKLKIRVSNDFPFWQKLNPVLPASLKKLVLRGWQLSWKDLGKLAGSLPHLEVLKLREFACYGSEWETTE